MLSQLGASQTQQKANPELVTSDSSRTTPAGATFMVPGGWSITNSPSLVVLTPPEPDSHFAIVDVHAADAAAAAGQAWEAYQPGFKRPLKVATSIPPRNGWTDGKQFSYETSPNERTVVVAVALKSKDAWTVALLDGSTPTIEKRGAQVNLIIESLRPKAYQRESFAGRKALALTPERIEELKNFVQTSMEKAGVPGAGFALIDGNKVVWEGGLGVRKLGDPTPVDANTLFMAASNTKGMTTLLLARLADERKLGWDQPVIQLYPPFKLGNADTTRQVLVKHLICACTGLPRQDLEWIFEYQKSTPESSMALLGTMQPTSKFGEVFQYSNLMAGAAGYVGAHLYDSSRELGAAYDEAMQKMIFTPLGMNSTTFDFERAQSGNHASPHGMDIEGKPALAGMGFNYAVIPLRPAGGVWTSVHDLSRYAQLELTKGKLPDGTQLVSEENLLMRRKPQVPTGEDQSYGMGLEIDKTWGVTVIHHGGSMAGYKSDWMILPDYGIGAVLLTDADNGGMILGPLRRRLQEIIFDGKPEAVGDLDSAVAAQKAFLAKERARLAVPASSDEVSKLAAHYTSTALGNLTVVHGATGTVFDFGEWKSTVASRKNDDGTVSFVTIDPTTHGFEFVVGQRDGKKTLTIRDAQHEYVFSEAA
jgi:CubicO group peptidase (beta-lactamase class C family)